MENVIIFPTFQQTEDELVLKKFEELFPGYSIATVDSNDIADDGGILNCITCNILK